MKAKTKSHNKSYTILIAEDSLTQALQARRILEEEGFRVAVCRNGKEALSYLKEQRPTIILSDIVMPEMDGYELCSTIKKDENLKDIPVILLTALTSPEDVIKGLQSGADNFITKPYENDFLLSRIQYILINQEARKKGTTTEIGLNIYFMGKRHTITSDRMQIVDLLLSTYEHAVLQNQELKRTHTELQNLNEQLEEKIKQRTQRIERLNSVLQAIRGVNQLIVREKNPDRLIRGACETLISARDYHNAWIALIDESGELVATAEAGLGKEFLPLLKRLKRGELVNCAQRALKKSGVIFIDKPSTTCADCPLAKESHARGVMAVRLEHGGKTFGLLSISIPKELVRDKDELSLFEEVAGDIAFGLHSIEMEEDRKQAQREIDIRNRIAQIFLSVTDEEMYGEVLQVILEAMESKYGGFAYIDEDGAAVAPSMTREVWEECQIPSKSIRFPRETWGDNIWSRAIIQKRSLYSNEPGRVPKGHVPIRRVLVVPIIHQGEVIGHFEVANKETDYNENDTQLLETIADYIATVLHARLQRDRYERERKRAEKKLKEHSEHLKEMAEERTRELKDAQEELIRKEKLALLGQLAGSVSHELRNPFGVISNAIYYLKTVLPNADETTKKYLEMISAEVRNSNRIVSGLLDISRTQPAERKKIVVSELVDQALEKQPPPEGIKVTTKIPSGLPLVFIDPLQISQVLVNLITNAYQAMDKGGTLNIKAKTENDTLAVSIKDTGCGISKENMNKLFEPLFTTRSRGIGLGLSVSKNLVEVNGGSIEVESPSTEFIPREAEGLGTGKGGKGSTFTVILPTKEVHS